MQKIMFKNTKKNFTPLPTETETREHLINNYHLIYYLSEDVFPEIDSCHSTVMDGSDQRRNENIAWTELGILTQTALLSQVFSMINNQCPLGAFVFGNSQC